MRAKKGNKGGAYDRTRGALVRKNGGDDRRDSSCVSFFMNKFHKMDFIEYDGKLEIHNSLLSIIPC
jgi:hypothetical protein